MTITQDNYTSNLIHSFYDRLKTIVGTTVTISSYTKTITYLVGWPPDLLKYKDNLPLIIIKHLDSPITKLIEMGGASDVFDNIVVSVIAGGLENESQNEFMKFALTDKIRFGFDDTTFNFKNIQDSEAVEGTIDTRVQTITRPRRDEINVFENHHSELLIQLKTQIKI